MIELKFFYPFSNFLRVTAKFDEEKAVVKTKSLTFEQEFEFRYEQVAEITYQTHVSSSRMSFSFVLLGIFSFIFAVFFNGIYARPWLLQVMRSSYGISAILVLASFIQNRYYYFLDKNKKVLMGMKVTSRNYKSIVDVIELVGMKSGNLRETAFDHPFPDSQPLFELADYDAPNYFHKCQTRFYEEEFIEFDKSMMGTSLSNYGYDQLSSEIYRLKKSSTSWDSLFWAAMVFLIILAGFYRAFDLPRIVFLSITAILVVILVIALVLKYVKREMIAFYDKHDRIVYFTWVTRANKEKVEKIIEFIQSKISAVTKK